MSAEPDPPRPEDPDRGLDVDAAFADIVAHWDPPAETVADRHDEREPADDSLRAFFTPAWETPAPEPDRSDPPDPSDHFVPPPPPPLPTVEPRRRVAWAALLGTPLAALLLVVLGLSVSGPVAFLMVLTFVGGFTYLVATMRSSPPDDWSGDDGAVV